MAKFDDKIAFLHKKQAQIRNMGIIAHIDHGKSTLSDSLLAGAGMMRMEQAGTRRMTDTTDEEQQRGITIQNTGVSMIHNVNDIDYLINLIDTPGHVDFGGEVTRALRAVDGALVVVCAVEGAMPQTETVLKQALKERVKPVLFINKVDRLLKELKLTPEQMQERFLRIIAKVNQIIYDNAPADLKNKWQINVNDGTVAFGTAVDRWGLSVPVMKQKGMTFKDVLDAYYKGGKEAINELGDKAPVHSVILDMVTKHLPNPIEAQKMRIPILWHGDLNSVVGKSLMNCDPEGPLVFIVTKIFNDPQAGELAFGRVFSGTLRQGNEVYMVNAKTDSRFQQVFIMKLDKREIVDSVPAGNIGTVIGLKGVGSGETVCQDKEMIGFEKIKHMFDPVVTKSIEPKDPQKLVKLIKLLRNLQQEDPTMRTTINEETGECLISGLGELHLEIIEHKIERDNDIPIVTSPPIVVYRESIGKKSNVEFGKSPNKHNHFFFLIEPMPTNIYDALAKGELNDMEIKKKHNDVIDKLIDIGVDREEAKRIRSIYKKNMLIDGTKGIVQIGEVIGLVIDGFKQVINAGPLAKEPCEGIKVTFTDCKLHEDAIHRGPAQVYPAVREGIRFCFNSAEAQLLEPVQIRQIEAPNEFMGSLSKIVQSRRGKLMSMDQENNNVIIKAELPVSESFGFTSTLRSATEGRGVWFLIDSKYQPVPKSLQDEVVKKIRQRKGMKTEE
ncbi:MAG: elongation factor EF-2 [Candidatus Nanoarchaeia archaeon]|jgi:elongation factor 2